jgi:PAS domain S-box-containing protein
MGDKNTNFIQCHEELALFQRGPVMVFKWLNDEAWTVTSASDNVEQILGYQAAQLVWEQKSYKELLHPDDLQRAIAEHEDFFSSMGQSCEDKTYRFVSRAGHDIWVSAHTIMIEGGNGTIDYLVSYVIDITKRILAENALRQREEMYRTLLDNQSNAVFLHKLMTVGFDLFKEVNKCAIDLYGYTREEFQKLSPPDITIHVGVVEIGGVSFRKSLLEQGQQEFETVHIKKSGERFPVQVSSNVVDLQGEKFILSTVQDITERKKAERERQLSNMRLLTVLNSIDASIHVSDMESHEILFMNENMVREFGQDFTGDSCWKVFRGEGSPCSFCTNHLLLDHAGQPSGLQVWQGLNPLTQKFYMNYDRAIQWTDGRMVKLQIAMDITEQKSMEAQLRQKFKMEAVGVRAGGIAHDFNNNLAIILGNIELAQIKIPQNSGASGNLNDAKTATLRARDLVQQILTYSRHETQTLKPLKLSMVIDETLKLLRSTIPSSIQIDTMLASEQIIVSADSTQVQEILINLCNNAVHAMGNEGHLQIDLDEVDIAAEGEIPAHFGAVPGQFARISIRDDGRGMETEVQERIFDPFFTTKKVGEGTGMGLAVVHGILESHHGFATVSSQLGEGSSFNIYLPITNETHRDDEITVEKMPHGNEQILFVDDEKMLTEIGRQMLSEHGYRVTTENSAIKGLELFSSDPGRFDLVITDQTMPDLSGKKLVEKMLKIRPDLPTIICTGHSDQIDEQSAKQMGVKAFCMKPLNMAELVQTVRQVLD